MAHTMAENAIANSRSGNLHGLRSIPSSSGLEASSPVGAASLSLSGSVQAGRRIAAQMLPQPLLFARSASRLQGARALRMITELARWPARWPKLKNPARPSLARLPEDHAPLLRRGPSLPGAARLVARGEAVPVSPVHHEGLPQRAHGCSGASLWTRRRKCERPRTK